MLTEFWESTNRNTILKKYNAIASVNPSCVFGSCNLSLDASNMVVIDYISYNKKIVARNFLCYECWCRTRNNMIENYPNLLSHIIRVIGPNKEILYSRVRLPDDMWLPYWKEDKNNFVPVPGVEDDVRVKSVCRIRGGKA